VHTEYDFDNGFRFYRDVSKNDFYAMYFPQYRFGSSKLLPYCSYSQDVKSNKLSLNDHVILLSDHDDCHEKVKHLLKETVISERARLISDILCFTYFSGICNEKLYSHLKDNLLQIDNGFEQGLNVVNDTWGVRMHDWLTSLKKMTKVEVLPFLPFYFIPYIWYEDEWESKYDAISKFIIELNKTVLNFAKGDDE